MLAETFGGAMRAKNWGRMVCRISPLLFPGFCLRARAHDADLASFHPQKRV